MQCASHSFDHFLTCDVEILDWSWRAVRSEDDTLAGAPRWSRMLTFLSLSAREIARGDVLPKIMCKQEREAHFTHEQIVEPHHTIMVIKRADRKVP